ncbi:hypothetical protein C8J56DRAFT_884128 [Mycena floridula]|nr:hypothetical protein C8J56DRAFT_884128 [Mycena floridula]
MMESTYVHTTTVKGNKFENILGNVLSNNMMINYIYPPDSLNTRSPRYRGYMPATTDLFFGRDLEIEAIVQALIKEPASSASKRVRFALFGAGGMGKTAMTLKLMRHPAILHCYSIENSVWVSCGETTSAAVLLDVIHSALGIDRDTHNTIHGILAETRLLRYIQIPTTLLFMVDSAIGGKTAIDIEIRVPGKGGTCWKKPRRRILAADPHIRRYGLLGDPAEEGVGKWVGGGCLGETAAIWDPEAFETLERLGDEVSFSSTSGSASTWTVSKSDPTSLVHWGQGAYSLVHGEYVSVWMILEVDLARQLGYLGQVAIARLGRVLKGLGLPVTVAEAMKTWEGWMREEKKKKQDLIAWRIAVRHRSHFRKRGATIPTVPGGGNMRLEEDIFGIQAEGIKWESTRGSEKLEKLNEQCGDIPTVVNSVRILHLTEMSHSSEVCAIIGHLLPSFSSLQWLDLEGIDFDAALLESIHTHPTLTAAIVLLLPSRLPSSPLSKIIQRTKTVGRQGDFPELEWTLNRGMQLHKLRITGNMSETVIGQLRIPHLRKLEISGSYVQLHSWLLGFVNNHPNLSKITFKDDHVVAEQKLRQRHRSIPFLAPFFEAAIESKLDDVFLRKFTIIRQPGQSGPEFKGWDVKALAILVDQSLPDIVRIASTLFPQVTKLTLDVDNMGTLLHIDDFIALIRLFRHLRTLSIPGFFGYIDFGGKTPWRSPSRGKKRRSPRQTKVSATVEAAMRWYILRLADRIPSLEAIHVKESGKDDPKQFWEWEFEGWYLPRRKLLVDGGGIELVNSPRLELP